MQGVVYFVKPMWKYALLQVAESWILAQSFFFFVKNGLISGRREHLQTFDITGTTEMVYVSCLY